MNIISIICIIVLTVALILIWIVSTYNKFKTLKFKIISAEEDISSLIRNEFDIINNVKSILSNNTKEEIFKDLENLKRKKLPNFEFERKLKEYISEVYKYKEKYEDIFKSNEDLSKFIEELEETEEYIKGCQEYYNDTVIKYNRSISIFPNMIIAKLSKQEEKDLYDKIEENNEI